MRSLVTIGGEPFSRVAFATNSNAMSTKPATAKKVRAGIARSCCKAPQHPKNIIALDSAGAALPLIKKSSVEFNAGKQPARQRDRSMSSHARGVRAVTFQELDSIQARGKLLEIERCSRPWRVADLLD
jgi:hypothetical protein